jgi:hypothetical protein
MSKIQIQIQSGQEDAKKWEKTTPRREEEDFISHIIKS